MTPLKSIRKFCIQCVGSTREVWNCGGDQMIGQGNENNQCWFYPYRMGRGRPSVKTIRKSCLECMGGSCELVRSCETFTCPVYIFRMGKNPNIVRNAEKIFTETAS